jgi:hypothetical protein
MSGDAETNKPISGVAEGDIARLRKVHPCGGRDWTVIRVGADIGLECRTCQRKVFLPRQEFEKRCQTLVGD